MTNDQQLQALKQEIIDFETRTINACAALHKRIDELKGAKEPWPIGTVLKKESCKVFFRYVVISHGVDGNIKLLASDLDYFHIYPSELDSYTPTGEHIDLSPLLGDNRL